MKIQYQFDIDKAIATMVAFLKHIEPTDKLKLIKLLYLADRDCFLEFGHPITGDQPVAMKHGPVPSGCLDVLNGEMESKVFSFLHVHDKTVTLATAAPSDLYEFADHEKQIVENTIRKYGNMTTPEIYDAVHDLPEYQDCYIPGTSTKIPYEKILRHHGTEDQYRQGRPVITRQMRNYLACPFPRSESPI